MPKVKYNDNVKQINDGKAKDRVWFKDSPSIVPVWEGVYNDSPKFMDIALYCMYSVKKTKLKSMLQIHEHLSIQQVLKTLVQNCDEMQIVIPYNKSRSDKIFFVNNKEIGFVHGVSVNKELSAVIPASVADKYNVAMIEFENQIEENYGNPFRPSRWAKPKSRMLTMYDENFILARECEMVSYEELADYMKKWNGEEALDNKVTAQNTPEHITAE